ncbi:MAG: acyl carrier protein [Planctomycetota bacterium]|nr:acyl carrier protein [Planctomycetota bacterium]
MTDSTFDRVIQVLVRATGLSADVAMAEDTPLVGGGLALDSVAVVELLVGLEKEFQIELSADDLLKADALRSVGTITRLVNSKRQEKK